MATLTQTSIILRNTIVFGSIGFIVLIVITLSLMNFVAQNRPVVVVPTPAPSALFGVLPPVEFPPSAPRPASFDLQLIEGKPPEATSSAPIYLIPNKKPSLFSKRQGLTLGKRLGFMEEPVERSETILDFVDPATSSTLTVDIAFNNLTLKRKFPDSTIVQIPTLTDERKLVSFAQKYFQELRAWDDNLSVPTVSYYTYDGQTFHKLPDARNAHLARVDFFQASAGAYPVVTSSFFYSGVHVVFNASNNRIENAVEASYQHFPADLFSPETYPTISGDEAWERLQAGEGYIASPTITNKAVVRRVYLAYYQPHIYQNYLQLVWVFTGDDNFAAYVLAIADEWIDTQGK